MLLRRIADHVKAQNWTAVALDFVIVVVGVFIGIQVSNWNDARGERTAEAKYLMSLEQDMRESITEIDDVIRQLRLHDEARHTLFDFSLGERQDVGPEDLPKLIHGALWSFASVELHVTTFDTLRNSGRLGVLVDDDLVTSLQDLAALIDEAEFEEGLELHVLERITDPFIFENVDMAAVLKTPSIATGDVYVSWLGSEAASLEVTDALGSQPFRNALLFRAASTDERIGTLQRIREKCAEIGERIDARQAALGIE